MKRVVSVSEILDIINSILEDRVLTEQEINEDLQSLGLTSVTFVIMVVELEDTFGIEIPDEYLLFTRLPSVAVVHEVITSLVNNEVIDVI